MPVTALVSAKSCGVTSSALALTLASRRPSLLAECDLAGGTIRAGFMQSQVTAAHGLHHLAAADRVGVDALVQAFSRQLWPLDPAGHRRLLPGLTDPAQAAALSRTWPTLADVMHVLADDGASQDGYVGHDVYIDAGRLALESGRLHPTLAPAPLLHRADIVLLVVRGTEQSLSLGRHLMDTLRTELAEFGTGHDAVGLLLIEDGPYRAHQVAEALGAPVLAALPWDPRTAGFFAHGGRPPRGLPRSPLLRHARSATEQIEAAASRRQTQQRHHTRLVGPQVAGVLQRLTEKGAG